MKILHWLRLLFHPWVIVGGVLVAGVLALMTILGLYYLIPAQPIGATPTVVITRIPANTPTPTRMLPTPTPSPTGIPDVPPPPPEGTFSIGSYVEVSGTGDLGLRLRAEPGLGGEVRYVALETEVFQIQDGPQRRDGFVWWYLVAPFDPQRAGWAAANYLSLVQNP